MIGVIMEPFSEAQTDALNNIYSLDELEELIVEYGYDESEEPDLEYGLRSVEYQHRYVSGRVEDDE
jgi:hypothetical protein